MTRPVIVAALLASPLLSAGGAQAQSYHGTASASVRYDDNLFRLSPAVRERLPDHGEDIVTYLIVSGGAQTRIGVVAVQLDAAAGQSFHANNPRINAFNYTGNLSARYETGQAQVIATAGHIREPVPFDDAANTRKVLRASTDLGLDASHDLLGDFRLVGRLNYARTTVDGAGLAAYGTHSVGFNGGVGYFPSTGNSITLEYAQTQSTGEAAQTVAVGNGFVTYRGNSRETAIVSNIDYAITPITSLKGSVGYTHHDDQSVLNADFSGLVANLALSWSPLPNLVIKPAFRRGFSSESRLFSNGITATRYSVTASDKLFGRLGVKLGLSRENRRFRYDLQATDPLALNRTETTTLANAGLSYTTGTRFALNLDYQHIERDSDRVNFPYAADTITFTVSHEFGS